MWIVIVVAVVGLTIAGVMARDDFHPPSALLFGAFMTLLATGGSAILVDSLYYKRHAFAAITACEQKRMQARRQSFSTNVVCVPAYRETKNDTTTVNLNTK